jgi:BolA protein
MGRIGQLRGCLAGPEPALFDGKSPLERHRMIYSALHETMWYGIHALHIRAFAPGEVHPIIFRQG